MLQSDTMFYEKPSLMTKAKMKQTAEIDKINNQKVAKKIDVYCNENDKFSKVIKNFVQKLKKM